MKADDPIKVTDAPSKVLGSFTFPDEEEPLIKYAVFPKAPSRYLMELVSSKKESPVSSKASRPIEIRLSGIVILVRLVQTWKALSPMVVS